MIYIAGKITGLPIEVAEAKFKTTELKLRAMGLKVINPMELGIKHWDYNDQMEKCFEVIKLHATAIFMQPDWIDSKGAKRELFLVGKLNFEARNKPMIDIYFENFNGYDDVAADIRSGNLKHTLIPDND